MYKITTLVENTAKGRGILAEHGISFLIESDYHRILFDTGQGMALLHNAKQLGISLEHLDAIALSHGHYDHTGGLMAVLQQCEPTNLYLHPQAIAPKYSSRGNIGAGISDVNLLQPYVHKVIWTEKPTEIIPSVYLTGSIPRKHPLEDTGGQFWQDEAKQKTDLLWDDQALFIDAPEGLMVVLGCAHSGVINTLDYISSITGKSEIYGVIGGMHLLNASPERIKATAENINQYNVQIIGANHCTGIKANTVFWHNFGDRCVHCPVGTVITLN